VALPDYPETKTLLAAIHRALVQDEIDRLMGPLSAVRRAMRHEGGHVMYRDDSGAVRRAEPLEFTAGSKWNGTDWFNFSRNDVLAMLHEIAWQFARQQSQAILDAVDVAATSVGNTLSLGGRPLSADALLAMLERIEIAFDDNGRPSIPQLIGPQEQIDRVLQEIASSNSLREQYESIISSKYSQWTSREADRNLAG
jgi:hypothetical protein